MIHSLIMDHNLRGYGFEYIAKILLRRKQKNNFIFQMCLFDSLDEVEKKYRLTFDDSLKIQISFIRDNWNSCDLIEFHLKPEARQKNSRQVTSITLYEVKTKHMNAKKPYFEMCQSNFIAMNEATNTHNITVYFASIVLFENWRFSLNCIPYKNGKVRTFTHYKEKGTLKSKDELLQEFFSST